MGIAPTATAEPSSTRFQEQSRLSFARWSARLGGPVAVAAVGLIVVQVVLRGWVAGNGYFYWDDLILTGRAGRYPLFSAELLLYNHDGHFMPLAFVTAWVVTKVAPLGWAGPVSTLLVLQSMASAAVVRMLFVLVGKRWAVLLPLVFYLFCPLTLPAFAWWAAGLNALPLQIAFAWVVTDAVLLVRTGRRRYAWTGTAVTAAALLFFEKAAIVPFVAFTVAVLVGYVDGAGPRIREVARRGAALWAGTAAALGCWLIGYLLVVDLSPVRGSSGDLTGLRPGATSAGVVTALVGGPWGWERWLPASPWAVSPPWTVVGAWLLVAAFVVWTLRTRARVWPIWAAAVVYVVAVQLPVALARGGPNTVEELVLSLRYLADLGLALTVAGALLLRSRPRPGRRPARSPQPRAVATLVALFLVSSLWSTYTFTRSWSAGPTREYVTTLKAEFTRWDGAPLLEQETPWGVLSPMAYPQNLSSQVLSPIAPDAFADSTPRLRMITDAGEIVDAAVWWNRGIVPGPEPSCGYRIRGDAAVRLPLDGPMISHQWTAQLNYFAARDGRIDVGFDGHPPVSVPVRAGMHTVYVRLLGSGSALRIRSQTHGQELCIGRGPVGVASYDN
ncbi:hypothetical protein [Nocardia brevicatena]|uniref:hypothetical protein n=1 Tax=Nocardia brevicatena TaxID=37327 RepID=UPI00030117AC|nr:hypothetical protein [Nocardia brevicatena]